MIHSAHSCVEKSLLCSENQQTIPADKPKSPFIIILLNIILRHTGLHSRTLKYGAYIVLVCKYATTFYGKECFSRRKILRHFQPYALGKQIIYKSVDKLQDLLYKRLLMFILHIYHTLLSVGYSKSDARNFNLRPHSRRGQ